MDIIKPDNGEVWTNGNVATGVEPSIPGAEVFEKPQTEIVNAIQLAGMTPDPDDLTQLGLAMLAMANAAAPTVSNEVVYAANTAWAAGVVDTDVVYWNDANSNYDKAIFPTEFPTGMANVTDGIVYFSGKLPTGFLTGLTVGSYYHSSVTSGAITDTAPQLTEDAITIGYAFGTDDFKLQINVTDGRATDSLFVSTAAFDPGITKGDVVTWHEGAGQFMKSTYGLNKPYGLADPDDNKVYRFGKLPDGFFTGLTEGADYYLSGTTAGEITTTATDDGAYKIGTALSVTEFDLDIDPYDSKVNWLWAYHFLGDHSTITYDANDTFTVPDGVYFIRVQALGAGGGGGGTENQAAGAGGAGRGGYAVAHFEVTPGEQFSIVIGLGGLGTEANGNFVLDGDDGGDTTFGTIVEARGGKGGKACQENGGSSAGGATGGVSYTDPDNKIVKTGGLSKVTTNSSAGNSNGNIGGDGGGYDGGGGIGITGGSIGQKAGDGTTPGSGGGAGGGNVVDGGDGANGQVIVEY